MAPIPAPGLAPGPHSGCPSISEQLCRRNVSPISSGRQLRPCRDQYHAGASQHIRDHCVANAENHAAFNRQHARCKRQRRLPLTCAEKLLSHDTQGSRYPPKRLLAGYMSANTRRPSDGLDRFLFVNKDASTIRVREKDLKLDTAIQSHVQRHMHRRSFAESQIASPILHEEAIGTGDFASSGLSALVPSSHHGPASFLEASAIGADFSHPADQPGHSVSPLPAEDRHQGAHEHHHTTGSSVDSAIEGTTTTIIQLPGPNPLRPIADLSDRSRLLHKAAPVLLNYWRSVVLPERFYFDSRCTSLSQIRHARAIVVEHHGVATRYARLCSLLASTATQMLVRDSGILVPHLDNHERTHLPLNLKTMAIEAIRSELSRGKLDKELVYDVQHLWAASDLNDSCGGANMHHKALSDMIERFGGLEDMGDYFSETHLKLHWYGSLARLECPPAGLSEFILLREPPHTPETHLFASELPQLISAGLENQHLCTKLLCHAKSLFLVTSHTRTLEAQQSYDANKTKQCTFRHLAIGYELLHLKYDEPDLEALRLGLIYYAAMVQSERFDLRCASRSIHHLRSVLEPTLVPHNRTWENHPEWLLWIAWVGGLTACQTSSEGWFAGIVVNITGQLSITSFDALEKHLSQLLYDHTLLSAPFREFYDRHISK